MPYGIQRPACLTAPPGSEQRAIQELSQIQRRLWKRADEMDVDQFEQALRSITPVGPRVARWVWKVESAMSHALLENPAMDPKTAAEMVGWAGRYCLEGLQRRELTGRQGWQTLQRAIEQGFLSRPSPLAEELLQALARTREQENESPLFRLSLLSIVQALLLLPDLSGEDLLCLAELPEMYDLQAPLPRLAAHPAATAPLWRRIASQSRGRASQVADALGPLAAARRDPEVRRLLEGNAECSSPLLTLLALDAGPAVGRYFRPLAEHSPGLALRLLESEDFVSFFHLAPRDLEGLLRQPSAEERLTAIRALGRLAEGPTLASLQRGKAGSSSPAPSSARLG